MCAPLCWPATPSLDLLSPETSDARRPDARRPDVRPPSRPAPAWTSPARRARNARRRDGSDVVLTSRRCAGRARCGHRSPSSPPSSSGCCCPAAATDSAPAAIPRRAGTGPGPRRRMGTRASIPTGTGDGKPVTFAFGGDVHFPAGTNLGDRLADDPATALGPTVPAAAVGGQPVDGQLRVGADRRHLPRYPAQAVRLLRPDDRHHGLPGRRRHADHRGQQPRRGLRAGRACRRPWPPGPRPATRSSASGRTSTQAFTPYRTTINGEKIAIIAATQVIDADLQTAWTATATQPGLASAYDVTRPGRRGGGGPHDRRHRHRLPALGHRARRLPQPAAGAAGPGAGQGRAPTSWSAPTPTCCWVAATSARPTSTTGSGNFAFYDNSPPENQSGVARHHRDRPPHRQVTWRPAVIVDDLPQPLTGTAATAAVASGTPARSCTDVTATPSDPIATPATETSPAPAAAVEKLSTDSG